MGGYERQSRPFALGADGLDAVPADFNGRLLPEEWERLEEIYANSVAARARDGRRRDPQGHQRTGGLHAGQRVLSRAHRRRGVLGGRRVLRARHRRRRRHRQGDGRLAARRRSRAWTCGRWTCAGSGGSTARRRTRWRGSSRTTRPTTTSSTPDTSGRPGVRCGCRRPTRGTSTHDAEFGEKSGWERVSYYRSNADARRRGAGGRAGGRASVVARDRGRAPRHPRDGRACSTSRRSRKLEVSRPGAPAFLEWLCDNRVARGPGRVTYTQMLNARGGIEADVTVTPARRGDVPGRHRHGVRRPRPGLAATARPRATTRSSLRDVTSRLDLLRRCGARRRATCCGRSRRSRWRPPTSRS